VPCFVGPLVLAAFRCSAFAVFGGVGLSTLSTARKLGGNMVGPSRARYYLAGQCHGSPFGFETLG
jgi:hypothetical protein